MKNKSTQQAILQSFIFNAALFAIIGSIGLFYIYPQYLLSEETKSTFLASSQTYSDLKKNGLSFDEFFAIHKSDWSKIKWGDTTLLNNILTDFREDDYKAHFSHTGADYQTFLDAKIIDAKEKRELQIWSNITTKINEILPEYSSDSSLVEDSLTDFKFVNNVEWLLDKFQLSTKDKIGIWELTEVGIEEEKDPKKPVKSNPLDGTIYQWKLKLDLIGEKKNIINFLHYIENVWKISVKDKNVSILTPNTNNMIVTDDQERIKNNFLDIPDYFRGVENPYNALVMEIGELSFSDYPDSSDLPTPDWYSLVQLIKESQASEKFEINITLLYYVKWLPTFKIDTYIQGVQLRYTQLSKIATSWFAYVSKNRASLNDSNAISAIGSLDNINRYLLGLEKEFANMNKEAKKREDLWALYKTAQDFNKIFEVITEKLTRDLQAVSDKQYDQHKDILNKEIK